MVSMSVPAATGQHEFRFGLGHPVLEFVATHAARHREPLERLATPRDLTRWLELSELASKARCDEELLDRARDLREAIYRTLTHVREGEPPSRNDRRLLNEWAREPAPTPQLTPRLQLTMTAPEPCRAALATLARSAIELVASSEMSRIRNCANPTCSLMFIDHSRPGRRRWCSMDGCGNRAKTARYRQRLRNLSA
jgi:predicted RNA-binding Zn ribbon-like protein